MNEFKRRHFEIVDGDGEYNNKIQKLRRRIIIGIVALLILLLLFSITFRFIDKSKTYKQYEVLETIRIDPVSDAEFYEFDGGVLKVSKNGAIYTDPSGELIWNQSFQMNAPIVDICEKYVTIGAKKGTEIYILDTMGLKGKIETTRQIREVEVAAQGTIAVITEKKDSYYINMYAESGEELVQGEMHLENSGYPLAMSLSSDALKLAVSLVDVSKGQADTTINFYNFGSVGQNEIDNLVKSYSYENMIVPKIHYFDKERVVAIGDNKLLFFKGSQKPEPSQEIEVKEPIRAVFYSDEYVGYTASVETKEKKDGKTESSFSQRVTVFNSKGNQVIVENYKTDYTQIRIIDNENIVLTQDNQCLIYNMAGVMKYEGVLSDTILMMMPTESREYYVLYKDRIEKIRFK